MVRKSLWVRAVTLGLAALPLAVPATGADRLERFRELAVTRLDAPESAAAEEARREVWALVDAEVLDNLRAGGLFASLSVLQDRLEQFSDAWGGASLRLTRAGEFLVGTFEISGPPPQGTVRVYSPAAGPEPDVLLALEHPAHPVLRALAPTPAGAQFLVVWESPPTARGSHGLRADLVRQERDRILVVWSTGAEGSDLRATAWSISGPELRVRSELMYPGWTLGCAHQTEQEDVYRVAAPPGTIVREAPRLHDTWHRDARAAAARLFDALATRDERTLQALVPDARLRARLPVLAGAPVCDAIVGRPGEGLLLGASEFDGRPWSLLLRRSPTGWRVVAATPVLE